MERPLPSRGRGEGQTGGRRSAATLRRMKARPQAWLIDLDGTLVDTVGDFVAALRPVAELLRVEAADAALLRRLIGRGGEQLLLDLLAHWQRPAEAYAQARERYEQEYRRVNGQHAKVFYGVREGLAGLQALGLPMVCVTNKPQANAEALLERLRLREFFQDVVGGAPNLKAKPAPDALLLGCARLALAPAQVGMLGDSENDALAARAAGCAAVVLLRHGYNHGEPIDAVDADAHLDRLDQLPAWLSDATSSPCPAVGP